MIRFEGVGKTYPDGTVAVRPLDLVAETGKMTVLVGPSGCGKTTCLRMINRMIEPTAGTIWLDEVDTRSVPAAQLRRGIGYVIQQAGLFPHRTVLDNVLTVPMLLGQDRRKARTRAMELLERVGLDAGYARRYPAQLSGGQQQRVGVARALAADPPVMLMDEPFSAVDPVVREQLQAEFLRLQSELGKTIVFVTHDIDEAIKLGDRVAVLGVGGVLQQFDAPAELLAHPANDFVASFVGRDRGYRALGFAYDAVPLFDEPSIRLGDSVAQARRIARDSWVLAVDSDGRPQGWLDLQAHPDEQPVGKQMLNLGGTLATEGGPLRTVLDAALSSPSRRGVVVDDQGRLRGTLTPADVVDVISDRTEHAEQRGERSGR